MEAKAYAKLAGISVERVRQLARAGRIKADRVEGRWQIEYEGQEHTPPSRRPLSSQSRADLLRFFVTMKLDHVKGVPKQRLAQRYRALLGAPSKSRLLLEWWGGDEPAGSFAERNFIYAAQHGDDQALDAMLTYPRGWLLTDPSTIVARVGDRMTLLGWNNEDLAGRIEVPLDAIQDITRTGQGHGLIPKLRIVRALDMQPVMVHPS